MKWEAFSLPELPSAGGWHSVSPKAEIILIFMSGIQDDSQRYHSALETLCHHKMGVYTLDFLGFGLSKKDISTQSPPKKTCQTMSLMVQNLNAYVRKNHPNMPIVWVGHSTGAIFVQHFVSTNDENIMGVVLTAPAHVPYWELRLSQFLFGLQLLKSGPQGHSDFIEDNTTKKYQNAWSGDSLSNWRTGDTIVNESLPKYPALSQRTPIQTWMEILRVMRINLSGSSTVQPPCLLMSGSQDSSNQFGSGMFKLAQQLSKSKAQVCNHVFIPHGRHDIWLGPSNDKTLSILLEWIQQLIVSQSVVEQI